MRVVFNRIQNDSDDQIKKESENSSAPSPSEIDWDDFDKLALGTPESDVLHANVLNASVNSQPEMCVARMPNQVYTNPTVQSKLPSPMKFEPISEQEKIISKVF